MTGDTLRQEREKQNLTIKDIEKGTSIRALYIESIEKGEYDKLPGEAYTKGFIRSYANFLKLDAGALVKQFMQEHNPEKLAAEEAAREQEQREEAARNPQRVQSAQSELHSRRQARHTTSSSSFATGDDFRQRVQRAHRRQNMVLALAVCVMVGAGAVFLLSSDDTSKPQPVKQTTTASKPASQPAAAKPAAAAPETKKYDDVEVKAVFTDRCWTSVKADGKTVYEGTIEKGETKEWKANEKVIITAGNAGAATVTVNGKDMGKAGEIGEVQEKTFTKDTQN